VDDEGPALATRELFRIDAILDLLRGKLPAVEEFEVFPKRPGVERRRDLFRDEVLFSLRSRFELEEALLVLVLVGDLF
jgi:hypothetical protein